MDNFFRGWRRKMGAATLLLTLLLTGGWIRSLSVLDQLSFPIGKSTVWYFISQYHYVTWSVRDEFAQPNYIHWEAVSFSDIPEIESFIADNQSLLAQLRWPGIGVVVFPFPGVDVPTPVLCRRMEKSIRLMHQEAHIPFLTVRRKADISQGFFSGFVGDANLQTSVVPALVWRLNGRPASTSHSETSSQDVRPLGSGL